MVLGSMLAYADALKKGAQALQESDFYFPGHQLIFNALTALYQKEKPADILLVSEELKRQNKLASAGGIDILLSLVQYAGTSAHTEEYIEELKKSARLRELIYLAQKMALKAQAPFANSAEIALDASEQIKRIEKQKLGLEKLPIRFLNQFEHNFLTAAPAKKAMLLEYYNNQGIQQGYMPKGIVAMLVGAGGVGKTHLLTQLALSLATGLPWLSTFTPTAQGKMGNVFLGLGENRYDDIHRILYKSSKYLRDMPENVLEEASKRIAAYSFCGQQAAFLEKGKPSRYFREFKMRLEELAPKEGWSLIILDPISRLLGADAEDDNASATQFIALLEELTIDLPGNPTVLFAHHVNKSAIERGKDQDQTAARGSSALTDGVRWQANFIKARVEHPEDSNVAILKMTKSNFTMIMDEIKTKKDSEGFLERFFDNTLTPKKGDLLQDIFAGKYS